MRTHEEVLINLAETIVNNYGKVQIGSARAIETYRKDADNTILFIDDSGNKVAEDKHTGFVARNVYANVFDESWKPVLFNIYVDTSSEIYNLLNVTADNVIKLNDYIIDLILGK